MKKIYLNKNIWLGDKESCCNSIMRTIHIWRNDYPDQRCSMLRNNDIEIDYKDGDSLYKMNIPLYELYEKLKGTDDIFIHCQCCVTRSPHIALLALIARNVGLFEAIQLIYSSMYEFREIPNFCRIPMQDIYNLALEQNLLF